VNAIIIAGGNSTRIRPLSNEIPKTMIEIYGKSILERQIELFQRYGISDITVVTGYQSEKINLPNITCIKNEKYKSTNVNEGLFCAKAKLNDSVVIAYGDLMFEYEVLERILNFKGDIGVGVRLNWKPHYKGRTLHPISEAENVVIENNKIVKIRKNISKCEKNQIIGEFIGIMKLSKNASDILVQKYLELQKSHIGKFHNATSLKQAYTTDMLQEIIDSDYLVEPVIIEGKWCEIDTIQDIEYAKRIFK
jgi:choline kinase